MPDSANKSTEGEKEVPAQDAMAKVPVNKETMRQAARVFLYLLPYKRKFFTSLAFLLVSSTLSLAFPYLIGKMLDGTQSGGGAAGLLINRVALMLMGVLGAQAVFSFFSSLWFAQCGQRGLFDLRCEVYARIISLPMSFFARRRVGELASRLSADLTQVEEALVFSVPQFLRQFVLMSGACVLLGITSWRLTLVMLASFPVAILVAIFIGRKIRGFSRKAQDQLAESGTVVEETLQGIANVKAFTNEAYESRRYSAALGGFLAMTLKGAGYRAALVAFIIFAIFGAVVLVMWAGAKFLQAGVITFGDLARFVLYTVYVGGAVASFADLYSQIQKTVGATARVRELLDEVPENVLPIEAAQAPRLSEHAPRPPVEAATPAARFRGDLAFEGVHFKYPSRPEVPVLRGLTLSGEAGERIALVGPSGAGKSTVVSLLMRFYEPDAGRILIDGKPTTDYPCMSCAGRWRWCRRK